MPRSARPVTRRAHRLNARGNTVRRRYIVGNWKMHGLQASIAEAAVIAAAASGAPDTDVAICPPATLIRPMADALPDFLIGAQDCHDQVDGAFTGSLSAAMLADAGARVVIVGHSERRGPLGESNGLIMAKTRAALAAGLGVILCIGEPRSVREQGGAEDHVLGQLAASLPTLDAQLLGRVAVAYEPIWAIGTGLTATAGDIDAMHRAIRRWLGSSGEVTRLLYGGSVNPGNIADILAIDDVDGALVGGASLTQSTFVPIIEAAAGVPA